MPTQCPVPFKIKYFKRHWVRSALLLPSAPLPLCPFALCPFAPSGLFVALIKDFKRHGASSIRQKGNQQSWYLLLGKKTLTVDKKLFGDIFISNLILKENVGLLVSIIKNKIILFFMLTSFDAKHKFLFLQ